MRRLSPLLVLLLLTTLIAACGGGDSEADPTQSPAEAMPTSGTAGGSQATSTIPAVATTAMTNGGQSTATAQATQPTQAPASTATSGGTSGGNTQGGSSSGGNQPTSSDFAYGFNVYWRGDDQGEPFNNQTIEAVTSAGFNWVRIQIQWGTVEQAKNQWDPVPLDRLVQAYEGSNVKILASVAKPPEWALDPSGEQLLKNYADFEGFMHFLAERYRGKIHAWEIWNEQNLAGEMGGRVNLDDYCHILEAGYRGVKQADPDGIVVFGGLTPTGVNNVSIAIDDLSYLDAFYRYRDGYFTKYFDVLGMHVSATNNPPDTMYPDNPGTGDWADDPSFYFRRAEQLRQVMERNGDTRPVWITEFGWSTANQAEGYEYGKDNSPEEQAEYLVRAFEIARTQWPWTTGMFVWNLNFSVVAAESDEKFPWAVLNKDWSPRPAYDALQEMPKS